MIIDDGSVVISLGRYKELESCEEAITEGARAMKITYGRNNDGRMYYIYTPMSFEQARKEIEKIYDKKYSEYKLKKGVFEKQIKIPFVDIYIAWRNKK